MAGGPRLPKIRGNDTMSVSYPRRVSSTVSEWRYTFQSVINTPCKRLGDTGLVPPSRFRGFRFRAVTTAVETMRPTSPRSPPHRLRSTVQTLAFVPTPRREPSDRTKKNPFSSASFTAETILLSLEIRRRRPPRQCGGGRGSPPN